MRSGPAFGHAEDPLDGFEVHFLDIGVVPSFAGVPKRGIEDAAFAMHFGPGDGEIVIVAVNARVVEVELVFRRAEAAR